MNPIQRAYSWAEKRFREMLFPSDGGGGGGWGYDVWRDGIPQVRGPNLIIPGVSDYRVDYNRSSLVAACVNWLCRTFPESPLQVVKTNRDGERDVIAEHLLPSLVETPNPILVHFPVFAAYAEVHRVQRTFRSLNKLCEGLR